MEFRPDQKLVVARRFKALRRKARLFQAHLAELIGVCRQSVSEIENARVMPHRSTWDRFCELEARHNQPPIVFPKNWLDSLSKEIGCGVSASKATAELSQKRDTNAHF